MNEEASLNDPERVKLLAYYLPQYHPIPENNEWWGAGFTEWTKVTAAKPLYSNHWQPRLPADLGFYDLRLRDTRISQAAMAKDAGVDGFVYWHYWFGEGRRILERPIQEVLKDQEPNFPFALGWANESWSRRWYGDNRSILIEQKYPGRQDFEHHFQAILPALRDPRYIRINGKPLFLIYRPQDLPSREEFVDVWQRMAISAGFDGLYLIHGSDEDPRPFGFDASYSQPSLLPKRVIARRLRSLGVAGLRRTLDRGGPLRLPYSEVMEEFNRKAPVEWTELRAVMPNWDNTPRRDRGGIVLTGSSPSAFRAQLTIGLERARNLPSGEKILFLKSWNEWAEGNYVEPDQKYGHAWLDAISEARTRAG